MEKGAGRSKGRNKFSKTPGTLTLTQMIDDDGWEKNKKSAEDEEVNLKRHLPVKDIF